MSPETIATATTGSVALTPARRPGLIGAVLRGRGSHSKLFVNAVRAALVLLWLGSWELCARTVIDPFFYSMPSEIWNKLVTWFTVGTSQGTIWVNITVTLEEAVLGFFIGSLADRVVVMTAGPATIRDVVAIDLPRPRKVEEIRLTPEFTALYRRVWDSLREEVEITRARGAFRVA